MQDCEIDASQPDSETCPCSMCGHKMPFPRKEGLWEYLENPIFDDEGNIDMSDACLARHNSRWIKVNIMPFHDDALSGLLLIPVGMKRPIDWPEKAVWRKIGDKPEIDRADVIDEYGYRMGDGKFMGKWDDESEAVMRRLFREGR